MSRCAALILTALTLCRAPAAQPKAELDCAANPKLLDTHFSRYGYGAAKNVAREPLGFRLRLPALTKPVGQIGVYSSFQFAGDFEVSATFELIDVPPPQEGYGVTCGIGIDTEGPGGSVQLLRGFQLKNPNGYFVTYRTPAGGPDWIQVPDAIPLSTRLKKGRLALRREKTKLICLIADGPSAEFIEFHQLDFTEAPIRKLRVFADAGGSPTPVDVRMGSIKVTAEQISGGIREAAGGWGWWLVFFALLGAGAGCYWYYRRRQQEED